MGEFLNLEVIVLLAAFLAVLWVVWFVQVKQKPSPDGDAYLEALELMADGNDRLAIQKLKVAVRDNSENISAYIQLGNLLRKKGMGENAIRVHQDLTMRPNLSARDRTRVLKSLLRDFEGVADYPRVVETASKLLETGQPVEPWVVESLVDALEKSGQWDAAGAAVARHKKILGEKSPERLSDYAVSRGQQMLKEGAFDLAVEQFKEGIRHNPENPRAYIALGQACRERGNLEEAVDAWMQLARRMPARAVPVFKDLEKACYELGRFKDVERLYEDLIAPPTALPEAGLALSEIYLKKGDLDNAMTVLKRVEGESRGGVDTEVLAKKLDVMVRNGQYKQAAELSVSYFKQRNGHKPA